MTTNRQTAVIEGDQHVRTNQQTPRVLIAAIAVAALALVVRAAPPVEAAGLTNCVDLIGRAGACPAREAAIRGFSGDSRGSVA